MFFAHPWVLVGKELLPKYLYLDTAVSTDDNNTLYAVIQSMRAPSQGPSALHLWCFQLLYSFGFERRYLQTLWKVWAGTFLIITSLITEMDNMHCVACCFNFCAAFFQLLLKIVDVLLKTNDVKVRRMHRRSVLFQYRINQMNSLCQVINGQ